MGFGISGLGVWGLGLWAGRPAKVVEYALAESRGRVESRLDTAKVVEYAVAESSAVCSSSS
jgi:hypothetical protein